MDLEQDLRSVSDDLLRMLEQLQQLEIEKRSQDPGSSHFVKLAAEIERLASIVFAQTSREQALADEAHSASRAGVEIAPIDETSPVRDVSLILAEWRKAERRVAETSIDSAEHATAAADVRRLREEYHRAFKSSTPDD